MEWGCMQALIDFDGWRKWKDFSQGSSNKNSSVKSSILNLSATNNNSNMMNASGSMSKESPKDGTKNKKAIAMNGGLVPIQRTGSGLSIRKEKRRSIGSGNLTEVLEDGNEDGHGGQKTPTSSAGAKVIVAGA